MSITKKLVFIAVGFFVGVSAILTIPKVIAHEGNDDPNLIHGCVDTVTDALRVVDVNTDCDAWETPIHFPATLAQLPPLACPGCDLQGSEVFKNKDLTKAFLKSANLSNANFEGTIFHNVEFNGVLAHETDFRNADMTGAVFSNTDLTGAVGMTTSILTDIVWSYTTCPDGTNSNSNDNSCEGHLTP